MAPARIGGALGDQEDEEPGHDTSDGVGPVGPVGRETAAHLHIFSANPNVLLAVWRKRGPHRKRRSHDTGARRHFLGMSQVEKRAVWDALPSLLRYLQLSRTFLERCFRVSALIV